MCYNPTMPQPRPSLPLAARDSVVHIIYHVVLHGTINVLNDYGEERQQRVQAATHPLAIPLSRSMNVLLTTASPLTRLP